MAKNIFEELGKEIDSIFNEGVEVLKEVEDSLTKSIDEADLEEKFADFSEFMKDISQDLEATIANIGKDIENEVAKEETKLSKNRIFNIEVSNIEDIVIKYSKKRNTINVKKEGIDRVFRISLKEGISKKKVEKILGNITFDLKTSLITITVKRKDLKKD